MLDSYLLRPNPAGRAANVAPLRQFLQGSLGGPALAELNEVLARYLGYLDEHDQRLGRERLVMPTHGWTAADVPRLLAWQEQRANLRTRMLGAALTRAWFEENDLRCNAVLRDWSMQNDAPAEPAVEADPNTLREQCARSARQDKMREAETRLCAMQLANIVPRAD